MCFSSVCSAFETDYWLQHNFWHLVAQLGIPWAPLATPWAPFGYPWASIGTPGATLSVLWTTSDTAGPPRGTSLAPFGHTLEATCTMMEMCLGKG